LIATLDLPAVGRALAQGRWIFAKTMPANPHEYTLRREWADDALFLAVAQYIRDHGYPTRFQGRPYTQLDVNAHTYWTMPGPLLRTLLINRKARATAAPYDAIAPVYDTLFREPADQRLDHAVLALLGDLTPYRVLDVGCGTGWLLDHAAVGAYTGIDPSRAMLARLAAKHPAAHTVYTPLSAFVDGAFDRVLALFGSASYLSDAEVARLPALCAPGGRYLAMAYAPGYVPVTYQRSGIPVPHRHTPLPLAGAPRRLGDFDCWEGGA
jgi:hypothetical protein